MNKLFPSEVLRTVQESERAEIEFSLDPDLVWFEGHFPIQPILPGVAQLSWVHRYARESGLLTGPVKRVSQMKFTVPLVPSDRVRLSLSRLRRGESSAVQFCFKALRDDEWITVSQGKVSE